jgi:O-antigen/teichoic acid export membrane protein
VTHDDVHQVEAAGGSGDTRRRLVAVLSSGSAGLLVIGIAATIRVPLLLSSIGAANVGLVITIVSAGQIALVGVAGVRAAARVMATEATHDRTGPASDMSLRSHWRWSLVVPVLVFVAVSVLALPTLSSGQSVVEFVAAVITSCVLSVAAFPGGRAWGSLEARGAFTALNLLNPLTSVIALVCTWLLLDAGNPIWVHATIGTLSAVSPFFVAQVWCWVVTRGLVGAPGRVATSLVRLEAVRSLPGLAFRSLDPIILTALGLGSVVADFTIIQRITLMMTGLAVFARPVWSRGAAARRAEQVNQSGDTTRLTDYYRATLAQAGVLGLLGAAAVILCSWLATFVVDFTIDAFWPLVALSAVVVLLNAVATVFITFLAGQLAARLASRIEVATAVLKVALTLALVQVSGAVGAVAATLVALGTLALLEYRLLVRRPELLADPGLDRPRPSGTHAAQRVQRIEESE